MPERHVPIQDMENILKRLIALAINNSDAHLTELTYKLIQTHIGFAKQALSEHFIAQNRHLTERLRAQEENFKQFLILYKILSCLYARILDKRGLNFLAECATQKMKSAPPDIAQKYAEWIGIIAEDLESSTFDLELDQMPIGSLKPKTQDELEMRNIMSDIMDMLLDLKNHFKDEGILLAEDYNYLRSAMLTDEGLNIEDLRLL